MTPVYSPDRKTLLGEVSRQTTSIGAAKVAGTIAAYRGTVNGKPAWIGKDTYGKVGA